MNIREKVKQILTSPPKKFLFIASMILIFFKPISWFINFVVNDLIYKTPKPKLPPPEEFNGILLFLYNNYWIIGIVILLSLLVTSNRKE